MVSALFGLAFAFLFQRVCKDRKCVVIQAPPAVEVENTVYELEDSCYIYTPKVVKCKNNAS